MNNQYSSYKTVKQKWVMEIPSHWGWKRLKAVLSIRKERNDPIKTDNILSLTAKQGVIPYAEKDGVGGNKAKADLSQYNIAHENDLLVNCMNVVAGSAGVSRYYGAISPVYYAFYPMYDANIWYYHHIFRLHTFQRSLVGLGKGILMHETSNGKLNTVRMRISMDYLGNVLLPVPPRQEQNQIVRFLDWKISQINATIRQLEKIIQLYRERELTIYSIFLTSGTDLCVPKKEVDSAWMKQIPSHWDISTIKRHFTIRKRIAGVEGYDILSITQRGLKVKDISSNEGQLAANYSGYQFVYPGDYAMNHMDLLTGFIDISKVLGVTSPDYRVFTLDDTEHCFAQYYLMLFQLCYKRKIFYAYGRGSASMGRWRMPADNFNNFMIPVPPIEEQKRIVDHLIPIRGETKAVTDNLEKQIENLEELKRRLISDVVTGKIDVRGIEIPEYEYVADSAESNETDEETEETLNEE